MNRYKAAVFDLDGTLLDTIDDLGNSMNSVLEKMGFPLHAIPEYKYFVGKGIRNLVTHVLPEECRTDAVVEECMKKMFTEYGSRWDEKTVLYEGIAGLLDELTLRGVKMAVLSNKAHRLTLSVTGKFLSRWKFEAVFGERDGVPRKPDPSGALEVCRIMNLNPADMVYAGDSGSDMETAKRAGMFAVGVLWGFRGAVELQSHGADLMIAHPSELLELF